MGKKGNISIIYGFADPNIATLKLKLRPRYLRCYHHNLSYHRKALNFNKNSLTSGDMNEISNHAAIGGRASGHSSISSAHMLQWTFSSSLESYLISCCACSETALASPNRIYLVNFFSFLDVFAFHLPSLYCFAKFGTQKGAQRSERTERNFHLLKFPFRIWPSPVARVCILKQNKNDFYRKLSGAREKWDFLQTK